MKMRFSAWSFLLLFNGFLAEKLLAIKSFKALHDKNFTVNMLTLLVCYRLIYLDYNVI